MAKECSHLEEAEGKEARPRTKGCEECLQTGDSWVHLRLCEACGHVGCCDDSKNKHATAHFRSTSHPVIRSFEPGESWRYCYVDDQMSESE
jgi:monovalent cation:H+ antiporter-2, CPA2 family